MQFTAFTRRTSKKQREMLRKLTREFNAYKRELREIDTFDEFRSLPPPGELIESFTGALVQIEIAAYVDGRISARKKRGRRRANSLLAMSDSPPIDESDLDAWLDEHVDFSWDLPGVNAIESFADDAADYSSATISNLLDHIKDDALKYLNDGMGFAEWRDDIMKLQGFESANPHHLRTNFDTAANGAYHAAKWHEIQEYSDIFPYLRYVTMQDELVREEHAVLDGIIARVDDQFWSIYYPPNGYNCRCSVEQLMEAEAEADPRFGEPTIAPDFDPRFQKNIGESNRIFT